MLGSYSPGGEKYGSGTETGTAVLVRRAAGTGTTGLVLWTAGTGTAGTADCSGAWGDRSSAGHKRLNCNADTIQVQQLAASNDWARMPFGDCDSDVCPRYCCIQNAPLG